jgi:hypothetical protein
MSLLYMVSDTDLVSGKVLDTRSEVTEPASSTSESKTKKRAPRKRTVKESIIKNVQAFFLLAPNSIAVCALAVLAYQGYFWFRHGWWKPLKARWVMNELLPPSFVQWLHSGTSWSGVNDIIMFVLNNSLVLLLIVLSLALRLLIVKAFGALLRSEKTEEKLSWRG